MYYKIEGDKMSDRSLLTLLCDGKDSAFLKVNDMLESLDKHHVSMEETKSMEDEIGEEPPIAGGGAVLATITLFVTCFSGYLVSINNSLMSALATRTSKMSNAQFVQYWHHTGKAVLNQVNEDASMLNVMSMLIWLSLAIIIVVWIFKFRKSIINRKRLQALHEYERKLLVKSH